MRLGFDSSAPSHRQPDAEPATAATLQGSLPVAYDEHVHTVFDEYSDSGDGEGEDDEDREEEDEEDENDANWARKEALRQGKVWTKGEALTSGPVPLPARRPICRLSDWRGRAHGQTPYVVMHMPSASQAGTHFLTRAQGCFGALGHCHMCAYPCRPGRASVPAPPD